MTNEYAAQNILSRVGRSHETDHMVKFYESPTSVVRAVTCYLLPALRGGEGVVVIARSRHQALIEGRLRESGIDTEGLKQNGRLNFFDGDRTLASVMNGSMPDSLQFDAIVATLVRATLKRFGSLRAYGEMVGILCERGNPEGAERLEELWNGLLKRYHFSLLCGYSLSAFDRKSGRAGFERVCGSHTHVVPTESFADRTDAASLLRSVALLQHETRSLGTELKDRAEHVMDLNRRVTELEEGSHLVSGLRDCLRTVSVYLQMLDREHGDTLNPEGLKLLRNAEDALRSTLARFGKAREDAH